MSATISLSRDGSNPPAPVFSRFARWTEYQVGRASTFYLAVAVIIVWAATGPLFRWSDTWQLIINTGTTVVTFLMVFIIQYTQTKDTLAIQLKLDELIRASASAHNRMIDLEALSDAELAELKRAFETLARNHR